LLPGGADRQKSHRKTSAAAAAAVAEVAGFFGVWEDLGARDRMQSQGVHGGGRKRARKGRTEEGDEYFYGTSEAALLGAWTRNGREFEGWR